MVNMKNEDNLLEPILVKIPQNLDNKREFLNVAPFFRSLDGTGFDSKNPLLELGEFMGGVARFIATASFEGGIPVEGFIKEDLIYVLFQLEDGLKKSTVVNM